MSDALSEAKSILKNATLCGSRYFAKKYPHIVQVSANTDYDFFTQYSDDLYKKLCKNELFELTRVVSDKDPTKTLAYSKYPMDDLAVAIFETKLGDRNIQLILRSDAELYTKVLHNLDPYFYKYCLWKSSPRYQPPSNIMYNVDNTMDVFNSLYKEFKDVD